jgi:DNA adenine methylase
MRYSLWSNVTQWGYREPFFGAGAIGFHVLGKLDHRCDVWLNDIDSDLVCLWRSVLKNHVELIRKITRFKPSTDAFYQFKENDGKDNCDVVERGFRKLALHRMSYSGFGFKSGGPLGGKHQQNSKHPVDCRWNPESMKLAVSKRHLILSKFRTIRITCGDFQPLIETANDTTFVYVDPPYYVQGPALYKHAMNDADHERLSQSLRTTDATWVLSYDDHSEIRRLYSWADINEVNVTYTVARSKGPKRPKNQEIVITPQAA